MELTRRTLLASTAALLASPASLAATDRRLIVLLASGGWDVTYAFDPKLGRPGVDGPELDEDPDDPDDREAVATLHGIPVVVNDRKRPAVRRFFEQHGHRTVVANGIYMASLSHEAALVRILTGTGDESRPDVLALAGDRWGKGLPLDYVDLSGHASFGDLAVRGGRLGKSRQLRGLVDPSARFRAPAGAGFDYPTTEVSRADLSALDRFVTNRAAMVPSQFGSVDALLESRERASRLRERAGPVLAGLSWGEQTNLASDAVAAVDLLQRNVCRAVLLDSRQHWDTHDGNHQQHHSFQQTFHALTGLVQRLENRGMIESTLVVVLSEMTRTPVRNAHQGKDHWPHTSALLIGGGLQGGRVIGGTDDGLHARSVDLDTGELDPSGTVPRYDHLLAGILEHMDVDPRAHIPNARALRFG